MLYLFPPGFVAQEQYIHISTVLGGGEDPNHPYPTGGVEHGAGALVAKGYGESITMDAKPGMGAANTNVFNISPRWVRKFQKRHAEQEAST